MSYTPTTENIFDAALHGARAVSVEMSSVLNESEFRAQLDRWLAALIREAKAEAWDEGVATALNYAKRQPDGITLKLETFGGDGWPNPYREGSET